MSNRGKAVGGISVLGVLGILFHLLHSGFSIYEYNHKQYALPNSEILSNPLLQSYQIENLDSIITIDDVSVRDSMLREAIRKKA